MKEIVISWLPCKCDQLVAYPSCADAGKASGAPDWLPRLRRIRVSFNVTIHGPRGLLPHWSSMMWRMLLWTALCFALVGTAVHGSRLNTQSRRLRASHEKFNYEDDHGPKTWADSFKKYCGGNRQSPVNIDTGEVDENDDLDEIDFDNYDEEIEDAIMENNGHTVAVTPGANDPKITVQNGGMDDEFKFVALHFHWGKDSKQGSEHTINGKKYPLEMHLVHVNTKYKSMEAAKQKEDGLAVLGVLFKVGDEDNDDFDPIIDKLEEVKKEGKKVKIDDFKLMDLLPDDLMPYYRYEGSLTTPPCNEAVIWTVFKDIVPISEKQLQQFRNMREEEDGDAEEALVDNFRPVQPLHGRVIEVSGENAAITIPPPGTTTIIFLALTTSLIFSRHF